MLKTFSYLLFGLAVREAHKQIKTIKLLWCVAKNLIFLQHLSESRTYW